MPVQARGPNYAHRSNYRKLQRIRRSPSTNRETSGPFAAERMHLFTGESPLCANREVAQRSARNRRETRSVSLRAVGSEKKGYSVRRNYDGVGKSASERIQELNRTLLPVSFARAPVTFHTKPERQSTRAIRAPRIPAWVDPAGAYLPLS